VLQLFARHRAGRLDAAAPGEVLLGLAQIGAPQRHVGLRLGAGRAQVRTERTVFASCASAWASTVLRVGLVELDQRIAALHVVGVIGADREHRASDLRRDLHEIAADVGVVGGLVVLPMEQPPQREAGAREDEDRTARR